VYTGESIRNVAVVGHGQSGKTSLVDALAFVAGTSKRHGSVKDGSSLTDCTPDEIERKYSISLGLAYAEWQDTKINLIDAPGYLDFLGDAIAAIYAADAALIVVSSTAGVEVGTEQAFEHAERRGIPRAFFVSLMDKEHADFDKVYQDIKANLTPKVLPVEIPVGVGPAFNGIVNLLTQKCHMYRPGSKSGEYDEQPVPAELKQQFDKYEQDLVETIASTDDALLERYLGGEEIPSAELIRAMHVGVARGEIFPLLCGASELTYGTRALLTALVELIPSPAERPPVEAQTWGDATPVSLPCKDDGPFVAQVFKTVSEPHVGDVTFFRIYSGTVKNGADVYNAPRSASEKLNHLSVALGKERTEVLELHAGDIGVVAKLRDTHTNDTLSGKDQQLVLPKIPFPEPVITLSVDVKQRGEEDKLNSGLQRLHEEDPTFHHEYNGELGQTLLRGRGERHLEIIVGRLGRKFGVHAVLGKPKVAYRETLKGKAEGQGKHKKQTGGRGQYGDCWIRVAPLSRGSGFVFEDAIVGGVIPRQYIPAVEKGVVEAAAKGPVAGYPMVDFKVELFDGSYHDVDSNEMSFKMAGILAFRNVTPNARPVLLEPIVEVEAWTPEDYLGTVMGDLSSRRGQILGTEADGRMNKIKALVPEAELDRYATQLHSITHGRGTYRQKFHAYQEVPPEVAAKVVEARKKEQEEAEKK
jgi:elongation factor G